MKLTVIIVSRKVTFPFPLRYRHRMTKQPSCDRQLNRKNDIFLWTKGQNNVLNEKQVKTVSLLQKAILKSALEGLNSITCSSLSGQKVFEMELNQGWLTEPMLHAY